MWPRLSNFGITLNSDCFMSVWGGKFISLSGQEGLSFTHIYHGWISSFIFVVSSEQNASFEQKASPKPK